MTEEGRQSAISPDAGPGAGARLTVLLQQLGQAPLTESQGVAFDTYLALLLRWNAKLNLTAIRDVEDILRRHFLESILCARLLPSGVATLLGITAPAAAFLGCRLRSAGPRLRSRLPSRRPRNLLS